MRPILNHGLSSSPAIASQLMNQTPNTPANVKRAASTSSKTALGQRTPTHTSLTATPNPQQRFALARLKARKEAAVFFKSVESWNVDGAMSGSLEDLSKTAKGLTGVPGAANNAAANNRQMKKAMSMIPGSGTEEASQVIMLVWDTPIFHKFRLLALLFSLVAFILCLIGLALNRFATFEGACTFGLWDVAFLGDRAKILYDSFSNSTLIDKIGRGIQGDDHDDDHDYSSGAGGCTELSPEFQGQSFFLIIQQSASNKPNNTNSFYFFFQTYLVGV